MDIPTVPASSAPRTGKVLNAAVISSSSRCAPSVLRPCETFGVDLDYLEPE